MNYCIIAFNNTHGAITTQKYLQEQVKITIMPTLRQISAACGISIRFDPEDLDIVTSLMENFPLDKGMYKIYKIKFENQQYELELLD